MSKTESSERLRVAGLRPDREAGAWSFALAPGGAVWIPDDGDSGRAWLDWLTGIEPPPAGSVFWKGQEWRERGPDAAAAERGRIGCLYATGGLIVNLDMDENVWLPARMHDRKDAAETIEQWARFFDCWPLPAERAPAVAEKRRRRILWTRAFAGRPELLVLEQPLRHAAEEDREALLEGVRRLRAEGGAVAWIAPAPDETLRAALDPLVLARPKNE